MNEREPNRQHPEDFPWNDVPGDSAVVSGREEPPPAEVVGEDGDEHDLTSHRNSAFEDRYHHDTLNERLAEEEPESRLTPAPDKVAELQGPGLAGGDVLLSESSREKQSGSSDELAAEDAAIRIRQE
jgi:hypothetical protein